MAQNNVDIIYKSLRMVPEFDGNPHVLTRFINLCDQLVLTYFKTEPGNELANLALINGILNRVTGSAARLINSNGIPDNWQGIRSALINNFADHRDETALYNDLSLQTQGSSTPQEFYERCQTLFSTVMTYVTLHETVSTTIEAKRDLYKKLTLQCYLRGLKDPLGSRIRCMRPDTMEKALEYVQEELNTLYMQQRSDCVPSKKDAHQIFNANFNLPLNNFVPKQPTFNIPGPSKQPVANLPGPSRFQPMYTPPNPSWRPNVPQFQQTRGPSRVQQMFRAPPPNYNPHSNVFRMPVRPQQPNQNFNNTPRPMSGVSHFVPKPLPMTGHDWRRSGNPPPSSYFKTREVNMNEFNCDYEYEPYYDHNYADYYQECNNYEPYEEYYPNYEQYSYTETPVVEELDSDKVSQQFENFHKESKSEKPK